MSWGGQDGTVILWTAALEFGVSEQEEQKAAAEVQDKSFLSGVFRNSYNLCVSTKDSLCCFWS